MRIEGGGWENQGTLKRRQEERSSINSAWTVNSKGWTYLINFKVEKLHYLCWEHVVLPTIFFQLLWERMLINDGAARRFLSRNHLTQGGRHCPQPCQGSRGAAHWGGGSSQQREEKVWHNSMTFWETPAFAKHTLWRGSSELKCSGSGKRQYLGRTVIKLPQQFEKKDLRF